MRNVTVGLLAGLLMSTPSAEAQVPGVTVGATLGVNSAGNSLPASRRTRPMVGAVVNWVPKHYLGVRAEVLYTMKGWTGVSGLQQTFTEGGEPAIIEQRMVASLTYLEVPVLVSIRAQVGGVDWAVLRVGAGPAVGVRIRCSLDMISEVTSLITGRRLSLDSMDVPGCGETYNNIDVSAVVDGGLGLKVGAQQLTLGARYSTGLTAVDEVERSADSKNRVLTAYVQITWPL